MKAVLVPAIIKVVMKVVATAVRETVTSTGITTDLQVQVVVVPTVAVAKLNHLRAQADHMLLLTVKTDRVVTDQADLDKAVETDQVVAQAAEDPAEQAADQVDLAADQLPVVLTVVVLTEDLRIKKSIKTRSRTRSRKPWPK
jgi:hypothetical protein